MSFSILKEQILYHVQFYINYAEEYIGLQFSEIHIYHAEVNIISESDYGSYFLITLSFAKVYYST